MDYSKYPIIDVVVERFVDEDNSYRYKVNIPCPSDKFPLLSGSVFEYESIGFIVSYYTMRIAELGCVPRFTMHFNYPTYYK